MERKNTLIIVGLLFIAVFTLLLVSVLFQNKSTETANNPVDGDTQGAYTGIDEEYIKYISTETRKTVPANAPEQKDEPSVERNSPEELIIDVVVEEEDIKQSSIQEHVSNPFFYRDLPDDVSVAVSYCPQAACPNDPNKIIPEDTNPIHATCEDRLREACGETPTGSGDSITCSGVSPTSPVCFNSAINVSNPLANGKSCTCQFSGFENHCACILDEGSNPTTPTTPTTDACCIDGRTQNVKSDLCIANGGSIGACSSDNQGAITRFNYRNNTCVANVLGQYSSYNECYTSNLRYKVQGAICIIDPNGQYTNKADCDAEASKIQTTRAICTSSELCLGNKRCTQEDVYAQRSSTGALCGLTTTTGTGDPSSTTNNSSTTGTNLVQCCIRGKEIPSIDRALCESNGSVGVCTNLPESSYCEASPRCASGLVCFKNKCTPGNSATQLSLSCNSDYDCDSDEYCDDINNTKKCVKLETPNLCNKANPGNRCESIGKKCFLDGQCQNPSADAFNNPNLGEMGHYCNLDKTCNDQSAICDTQTFFCIKNPNIDSDKINQVGGTVINNNSTANSDNTAYGSTLNLYENSDLIHLKSLDDPNSPQLVQQSVINDSVNTFVNNYKNKLASYVVSLIDSPEAQLVTAQAQSTGQTVSDILQTSSEEIRNNICSTISNCKISENNGDKKIGPYLYTCIPINEVSWANTLFESASCDTNLGRYKQKVEGLPDNVVDEVQKERTETRTCERDCYFTSTDISVCIASNCGYTSRIPQEELDSTTNSSVDTREIIEGDFNIDRDDLVNSIEVEGRDRAYKIRDSEGKYFEDCIYLIPELDFGVNARNFDLLVNCEGQPIGVIEDPSVEGSSSEGNSATDVYGDNFGDIVLFSEPMLTAPNGKKFLETTFDFTDGSTRRIRLVEDNQGIMRVASMELLNEEGEVVNGYFYGPDNNRNYNYQLFLQLQESYNN